MISRTDIAKLLLIFCGAVDILQFSHLTLSADETSRPRIALPKTVEDVSSIAFAPDDRSLLLGGCPVSANVEVDGNAENLYTNGYLVDIDIAAGSEIASVRTGGTPKTICSFADGRSYLFHCLGGTLGQYSRDGTRVTIVKDFVPIDIAFCSTTSEVLCARRGLGFGIWKVDLGDPLVKRTWSMETPLNHRCAPVALSNDGELLAVGALAGSRQGDGIEVRVLRRSEPTKSIMLALYQHCISAIRLSSDGSRLIVGDGRGVVEMWDVGLGEKLWAVKPSGGEGIYELSVSSDARLVAICSQKGVHILDSRLGRTVKSLSYNGMAAATFGHKDSILAIAGHQMGNASPSIELLTFPLK